MFMLIDGRWQSTGVACLVIALTLASHAGASAQADKEPPWLDMLKNDKRLQVKMSIDLGSEPTVDAWFAAIKKEAGVTLTLADPPKTGRIDFSPMIVAEPKRFVWAIMRAGTRDFSDPVWEKTEDGYRLHGKPKRLITPEQEQAAAAKKKANEEAVAKAAKAREELAVKMPLRFDVRLHAKLTLKEQNPKLSDMLAQLDKGTGLRFALANNLTNHDPKFDVVLLDMPAWMMMEAIAKQDLEDGNWVKTVDGYRLTAKRSLRKAGTPAAKQPPKQPEPPFPGRDGRLFVKLSVVAHQPKFADVLQQLHTATGLNFTLADHLLNHEPVLGDWQFRDTYAWVVMRRLSEIDLVEGRWEQTDDGYRLTATASLREKPLGPPPPPSPWWSRTRVFLTIASMFVILGITAYVLFRRRRKTAATSPSPPKPVAN